MFLITHIVKGREGQTSLECVEMHNCYSCLILLYSPLYKCLLNNYNELLAFLCQLKHVSIKTAHPHLSYAVVHVHQSETAANEC